jgi:phytol kinase
MINNVWLALGITFIICIIFLRINDYIAHRGFISGPLSRKIIHIGTGPIFVLCWFLFPDVSYARYLAAVIPFLITAQFAMVGLGIMKDQAAVAAMSRTGDRKEILRGPLFYGIVFVLLTIVYWKDNLIGIVGLMLMCGGDGLADIIGKRYGGNNHLPWSKSKTWAGSFAMFLGGWILAVAIVVVYLSTGVYGGSIISVILKITLIAIVATLVESLPYKDIDNITVTLSAVILGHLLGI